MAAIATMLRLADSPGEGRGPRSPCDKEQISTLSLADSDEQLLPGNNYVLFTINYIFYKLFSSGYTLER